MNYPCIIVEINKLRYFIIRYDINSKYFILTTTSNEILMISCLFLTICNVVNQNFRSDDIYRFYITTINKIDQENYDFFNSYYRYLYPEDGNLLIKK